MGNAAVAEYVQTNGNGHNGRMIRTILSYYNERIPDEGLADLYQRGDQAAGDALFRRYTETVRSLAHNCGYFLLGAEFEDKVQEANIGFTEAMWDFRPDRSPTFRSFWPQCAIRQIITAAKAHSRQKHVALNDSLSLDAETGNDGDERTLGEMVTEALGGWTESRVLDRQDAETILSDGNGLSKLERAAVTLCYRHGYTYREAAWMHFGEESYIQNPKVGIKSIDNALVRAKRKVLPELLAAEAPAQSF